MRVIRFFFCLFCFYSGGAGIVSAQKGWTSGPFEQKVFIENEGQFNGMNGDDAAKILFGASADGVDLYFTAGGLIYKHNEQVAMTEEEREQAKESGPEGEEDEEDRQLMKTVPRYLSMEWVGANPGAEIIREEPVEFYYTYHDDSAANKTIKASAYKKILYRNLYPGIDIEYTFPGDKQGIKYALIVHPGGNSSLVKMRYKNAEHLSIDKEGNVVIRSSFGDFTDHRPFTFYQPDGEALKSYFVVKDNEVSFQVNEFDHSRTYVIDPWTTNPAFATTNSAYDVNYDLQGNVYVYGSQSQFKLAKFNSAGVIQWTFNTTVGFGGNYGDFAVDEVTGTSYLIEGFGSGIVWKINTLGVQTGTFPGTTVMNEMWRAEYNRCINKIVIAGGGTSSNHHGAILDTNMVTMTPINVLSTLESLHDMAMLAIDNSSNFCYMASAKSVVNPTTFDNVIIKCPIPALVPVAFLVPDGHKIREVGSVVFPGITGTANGMNGMAVSPNWLYTYDSDSLKRWDKTTGALIAAIDVSPFAPTYLAGIIQIPWAGITVDECDNIYVGFQSKIKEYNSALALVDSFSLPGNAYDLKLGPGNKLYACGAGFVKQIDLAGNNIGITITTTPSCSATGTATVSSISCGSLNGFSYVWNTIPPQFTQTATGLGNGTYTVTITTNCSFSITDSVTMSSSYNLNNPQTLCNGLSYSINSHTYSTPGTYLDTLLTMVGGCDSIIHTQLNFTSAFTTNNPQNICPGSSYVFNGHTYTTNGNFPDTLTAVGGCDSIIVSQVTVQPSVSVNNPHAMCTGQAYTINSHTYSTAGTYHDTLFTSFGCDSVVHTILSIVTQVTANNPQSICSGSSYTINSHTYSANGTFLDTLSAGAGCDSIIVTQLTVHPNYSVNNLQTLCNGQSYSINSHTYSIAGTYHDTLFSSFGCDSVIHTVLNFTSSFTTNNPQTICNGNSYFINGHFYTTANNFFDTLTAVGGCDSIIVTQLTVNPIPSVSLGSDTTLCTGQSILLHATASGATYLWQDNSVSATYSATQQGLYWVKVTVNNCEGADSVNVAYYPLPIVHLGTDTALCIGQNLVLDVTSAGVSYLWQDHSVSPTYTVAQPGLYWVIVATLNLCTDTVTDSIQVNYTPLPLVRLANDTTLCEGENLPLAITLPGVSVLWQDGSVNSQFNVTQPGTYWVQVTTQDNCRYKVSDSILVHFNPLPLVYLGQDTVICEEEALKLNATVPNASYQWQDGSTNPTYSVSQKGMYRVKVQLENCATTDSVLIETKNCHVILDMPNVFSPNNDGTNDFFIPKDMFGITKGILTIYNRWGKKIFESSDIVKGWDGKNNGKDCSDGVYYWILQSTDIKANDTVQKGFLTLIR